LAFTFKKMYAANTGRPVVVRDVYTSHHPVLIMENGELPRFMHDPRLSPWQNFYTETTSALLVKNIFYPLEVAQTLMQTGSPDAREGVIPTLTHLYKSYGLTALFRGNVAANISGSALAMGTFLMKVLMHGMTFENRVAVFLGSLLPAQLVVGAVYPLQVAKVRMISNPSKYLDVVQTIKTINEEEGTPGLYRGFGWTLMETIPLMATTYAGFELANLAFRRPREDLTIKENILLGILGSFLAALLHYPFDTAKKIVQSRKASIDNEGVLKTLAEVGEKHGLVGLYKGLSANLLKLPALWIQRAIFEAGQVYLLRKQGIAAPFYFPIYRV